MLKRLASVAACLSVLVLAGCGNESDGAASDPSGVPVVPVVPVRWRPCYRVVPSRFPPISLFERVADPADLDAVFAVEAMTDERAREAVGVPAQDSEAVFASAKVPGARAGMREAVGHGCDGRGCFRFMRRREGTKGLCR